MAENGGDGVVSGLAGGREIAGVAHAPIYSVFGPFFDVQGSRAPLVVAVSLDRALCLAAPRLDFRRVLLRCRT